jgi:hypothetical protein
VGSMVKGGYFEWLQHVLFIPPKKETKYKHYLKMHSRAAEELVSHEQSTSLSSVATPTDIRQAAESELVPEVEMGGPNDNAKVDNHMSKFDSKLLSMRRLSSIFDTSSNGCIEWNMNFAFKPLTVIRSILLHKSYVSFFFFSF